MKKILIVLLIAAILVAGYFISGFYGNPVSKMLGKSNAEKFVHTNYSEEYKYEGTNYSFKTSKYHHRFFAENSKDKHFVVSTNFWGKVEYDDYEIMKKGFNTFIRFESELRKVTDPIIEANFGESILSYGYVSSDSKNYEGFPLDTEFSMDAIPRPLTINLQIKDSDTRYENLAKLFFKVDDIATKHNLDIDLYSLGITNNNSDSSPYDSVQVVSVPKKDWKKHSTSVEELAKYLEEYSKKYDEEHRK